MNILPRLEAKLKKLPQSPGVYIYKNSDHKVIYIGKAVNLKKRVSQYFQRDDALGPKTSQLVSQINDIEYKIVDSEIEALILEACLIKQFLPKFNSLLKDDRSYIYISITKDKYPLVRPAFKSVLNNKDINFGPFPNGRAVKNLLNTIRRIFPYYSKPHPSKECLYCHLGLCPGPNITVEDYKKNISKIKSLLNGNLKGLIKGLTKDMNLYSQQENYEEAKIIRDQINSINYVISGWASLSNLYTKIDLPEDQVGKSLGELESVLKPYFTNLKEIKRIEAFDISNLGSNYFVGSMVVFQNCQIDKDQYRKFRIYTKFTPDDQYMIKEIIWRRFKHLEWELPQIILVDGGKPQVSAAHTALIPYQHIEQTQNIAIIGLAKKLETVVIKTPEKWVEINLPKNSSSLNLLQQLRDEAHRFANSYRKELIKRSVLK